MAAITATGGRRHAGPVRSLTRYPAHRGIAGYPGGNVMHRMELYMLSAAAILLTTAVVLGLVAL